LQFVLALRFGQLGGGLLVTLGLRQLAGEGVTLFFDSTQGFGHGELARDFSRINPGFQCLDLGIFGRGSLL
jgi:hypothetical protein